ncbi:MAG: glycosyltransferase family 4 protein [bacterium]
MKIALVGPTDRSIWAFRRGLIRALCERGHNVYVLCPSGDYVNQIERLGAIHIAVKITRFMDPLLDLKYLATLCRVFSRERFHLVHNFTIKPNVFGAIAARLVGVPRVYALIEGLGFGYPEGFGLKPWISRRILLTLYRICCLLSTRVWFINLDDMRLFLSRKVISKKKTVFIRSVGVNIEEYSPSSVVQKYVENLRGEFGDTTERILYVTMVGRMIWPKGVREFVDAARELEVTHINVKFLLVGEIQEGSPQSVPREYLRTQVPSNFLWLDFRHDVKEILALSDIVVLPSYYREGVPRCLLEAMAMRKPIVAVNSVGNRELIVHGENGYLVPMKNSKALASAIQRLIDDPKKRSKFGEYGRSWVEKEFDERIIVDLVLKKLYSMETV